MSVTRNEWWHQFSNDLRAKMREDLKEKFKALNDASLGEEEFLQAFDKLSDMVVENADCVRPQVWVYVIRGFANAVSNEMTGGNPCPPLNDPLTQ